MKVKTISRSTDEFTRERSGDLQRVFRNPDPTLHAQAKAQEYVRAVNAAKLDRVFAKPFIAALDSHIDAVSAMAKDPKHLKSIFSGSMDGDIRLWDIAARRTVARFPGHRGAVRGLSVSDEEERLVSCGDDCIIRVWDVPIAGVGESDSNPEAIQKPVATYVGKNSFRAVDHKWQSSVFATGGVQVDIWDHNRSEPINSFTWGSDTVVSVRFNPSERDVFASTASDRSIALYDLRMGSPLHKIIMQEYFLLQESYI
eukprot:TRINITY_DN3232_c0_g1_i1.p1 TRINITY_DN3232_c0_g1~~TRINITY_DN3232_c0_g1_i1.p1  ORF type:complete len:256 (+),score=20.14 TRINITY_DN3232_c0_g1_i1:328-1095(+)